MAALSNTGHLPQSMSCLALRGLADSQRGQHRGAPPARRLSSSTPSQRACVLPPLSTDRRRHIAVASCLLRGPSHWNAFVLSSTAAARYAEIRLGGGCGAPAQGLPAPLSSSARAAAHLALHAALARRSLFQARSSSRIRQTTGSDSSLLAMQFLYCCGGPLSSAGGRPLRLRVETPGPAAAARVTSRQK